MTCELLVLIFPEKEIGQLDAKKKTFFERTKLKKSPRCLDDACTVYCRSEDITKMQIWATWMNDISICYRSTLTAAAEHLEMTSHLKMTNSSADFRYCITFKITHSYLLSSVLNATIAFNHQHFVGRRTWRIHQFYVQWNEKSYPFCLISFSDSLLRLLIIVRRHHTFTIYHLDRERIEKHSHKSGNHYSLLFRINGNSEIRC